MIKKRKQWHLRFKAICGPKASNCGNYLILLVTVLFIREEWLRLLMLLKTGLPRQIFFEKLLQIHKIHSSIKILVVKWVKNWKKFSHGLSYFPPFHLLTSIFSILYIYIYIYLKVIPRFLLNFQRLNKITKSVKSISLNPN